MGKRLKVALVQTLLHWENPMENRKMFSDRIQEISDDVDLIVLPEMFTTGFTMSPENITENEGALTISWMKEKAAQKNAAVVGSFVYNQNGTYYNRLFFVKPNGDLSFYDKKHTFTLAGEDKKYRKGTEKLIETFRGFRICPLICYDLRFPVWSRNTEDYDVLVYVANWPEVRIAAWDTLLKARAIENMSYCIGVNRVGTDINGHAYSGHSAAFDSLGKQLCFSDENQVLEVSLSLGHLQKTRSKLGFLKDRDSFNLTD
ncbi:amidohydrolase [Maribacter sp. 2210JD10-5]|uniref:amidohydrolase n=1 Tax=Maribacter sp. 2210JD10-5 TaxID=3386272 RepID=UPI0039BCAD8A